MSTTRPIVLVADDLIANVETLANALADDCDVIVALSGADALQLAFEQKPALILLDVMMGTMSGYDVCKLLKQEPNTRNIPIIFVTSLSDDEDETRGLELGAIDYIMKPVRPAIVRARVHNHLERERVIAELQVALSEIRTLSGLIPVCAWCRKLRDDKGYWVQLENYFSSRGDFSITHGICPECANQIQE